MTPIPCSPAVDTFRCPTKWELWRQVIALLPRGRAWQTHERSRAFVLGDDTSQFGTFQVGHTGLGEEMRAEALTAMERYWAAFAEVLEYLHQRGCALIEEMFCSTVRETLELWAEEYGFPDPCLPYDSLCEKVNAQGGSTCAYLTAVAARRGWVVTCSDEANEITLTIDLDLSPAYQPRTTFNMAGSMISGLGCNFCHDPSLAPLECLIERIKPAHVLVNYVTTGGE